MDVGTFRGSGWELFTNWHGAPREPSGVCQRMPALPLRQGFLPLSHCTELGVQGP